tara:strand:+ start:656 stop:907 length:252 start_codon:yes stop_codon:yes gene_type:complete
MYPAEREPNMSMIVETTMTENNKMMYALEARGTKYQVVYERNDMYAVWSKRNSLTTTQLVLMTLKEMKARSKALNHLATLIEM